MSWQTKETQNRNLFKHLMASRSREFVFDVERVGISKRIAMCGLRTLRKARAIEKVVEKILTKGKSRSTSPAGGSEKLGKGHQSDKGKGKGKGKSGKSGKAKGKGKRVAEWSEDEEYGDGQWSEPETVSEPESASKTDRLCVLHPQPPFHAWIQDEPNTQSKISVVNVDRCERKVRFYDQVSSMETDVETWSDSMDGALWLLDSGASKSVVNPKHLHLYRVLHKRELPRPLVFSTANGDTVEVLEEVILEAFFWIFDGRFQKWLKRSFELRCLVSDVQHNLLSALQIARQGFEIAINEGECSISYGDIQFAVEIWGNCPWITASVSSRQTRRPGRSSLKQGQSRNNPDEVPMDVDCFRRKVPVEGSSHVRACSLVQMFSTDVQQTLDALNSEQGIASLKTGEGFSDDPLFPALGELIANDMHSGSLDPSVVAQPDLSSEQHVDHDLPMDVPGVDLPPGLEKPETDRLSKRVERNLFKHRLEGHSSYDPQCDICKAARRVHHHRRRNADKTEVCELISDFGFYSMQDATTFKYLTLVEPMSNAAVFIHVGMNVDKTVNSIKKFLQYVGFASADVHCKILVKVDDDAALARLFRLAGCVVEKAGPQQHETIGLAERFNRVFKEHMSAVRLELQASALDLKFTEESIPVILQYVSWTLNQFRRPHGGSKTPHEILTGHTRTKPTCSMFGALVFCEVPQSVQTPANSRWIVGAFLGAENGEQGIKVCSECVDSDGTLKVKVFTAKTVRAMNRLLYDIRLCPQFLIPLSDAYVPRLDEPIQTMPTPQSMPKTGPPAAWLKENGKTDGCYGCHGGTGFGKRVHSVACRKRYQEWLKQQQTKSDSHRQDVESVQLGKPLDAPPKAHPTGKIRYNTKRPAAVLDEDASMQDVPQSSEPLDLNVDHDVMDVDGRDGAEDSMSVGSPSLAPSDIMDMDNHGDAQDVALPGLDEGMDLSSFDYEGVKDSGMDFFNQWTDIYEKDFTVSALNKRALLRPLYLPKIGQKLSTSPYQLCGKTVYLVKPVHVQTEDQKLELDVNLTMDGRKTELDSLNAVSFGELLDEKAAKRLAKELNCKIIPMRWVVNQKEIQLDENKSERKSGVRTRLVVQQVAAGAGAAGKLGFSSNTPSAEAVRAFLALGSRMGAATLDASAAFLHSKLPKNERAIVRMPADVSFHATEYEPVYVDLYQALNGLRCASRAWLNMVREATSEHGLMASPTESSVFAGNFQDPDGSSMWMAILCYVDDLLVVSPDPRAPEAVQRMLKTKVSKVKITGQIPPHGSGKLEFLGREIVRGESTDCLKVRVPPEYLHELTKDLKATDIPPNLDKLAENDDSAALDEDAAHRYRASLGRFSWWCQTRSDFLRYAAILSMKQQNPTIAFEKALNKVLRYAKSSLHCFQEFRWDDGLGVVTYADASWGARSVTGFVITWHGCTIKCASRQQASKSLSSCESELISLTVASQETLGLCKLFRFLESENPEVYLSTIEDFMQRDVEELDDSLQFELVTDAMSAYQVLIGDGFSRRVRHLDIGVGFLQRLVQLGILCPRWVSTNQQLADLLTKCLGKEKFEQFRREIGILASTEPESWQFATLMPGPKRRFDQPSFACSLKHVDGIVTEMVAWQTNVLILDLCSEEGFKHLHGKTIDQKTCYVVQSTQHRYSLPGAVSFFQRLIHAARKQLPELHVLGWFSPPCTGGSPMQHLCPTNKDERIENLWQEFVVFLKAGREILKLCDLRGMELSLYCSFWRRHDVMQFVSDLCPYTSRHDRCRFESQKLSQARHSYRCQTSCPVTPTRCKCQKPHMALNSQSLHEYGWYPRGLTKHLIREFIRYM